jgi:hypothetical protein
MKPRGISAALLLLMMTGALWASGAPATSEGQAAFERMKSLAGDWEGPAAKAGKAHLRYEVVSGGSAVLEHFESDAMGPANAMVTMYYLEGDHLQLTHYCMAKNQPHMQAESFDSATGELRFAFVSATGLSSPEAGHMHNATFRFTDADHISQDWEFFQGGKPKFTESVQYTRVH